MVKSIKMVFQNLAVLLGLSFGISQRFNLHEVHNIVLNNPRFLVQLSCTSLRERALRSGDSGGAAIAIAIAILRILWRFLEF